MAIGDFEALFGTSVNRFGFGFPETTVRDFHGVITASPITGLRKRAQERTINRGWHRRKGKPDKWEDIISVTWHLDVHRLMSLQAATFGHVTPTLLGGTAYQQVITPDPADAYTRFHTLHFNRNGRVYVHFDAEPLSMAIAQGDSFWDCTMEIGARYISHNQAFPTATVGPTSYNGVCYAFGVYNGGVNTAVSFTININGNGTFGAATVRTQQAGAGSWGTSQVIYADKPIPIVTNNTNTETGLYVVFTDGAPTFTIIDFSNFTGPDNVDVTVDGVATNLIEGGPFSHGASNAECALNLATAINASGVLGPKVVAENGTFGANVVVRVRPKAGYTTVVLASSDPATISVQTTLAGNTFTIGDNWTDSSQGVVVAGTAPDHTVFSPNSFEIKQVTYGGADFDIEPNTMGFAFTRELQRDDYVLTSPYVRGYPKKGHVIATGTFKARSSGSKYIQDAASNNQRAILIMMEGQFIGATAYRERIQFSYPQIRLDPGVVEALNEDFVNYHECAWTAEASTDTLNDFFAQTVYTDQSRLDW